MIVSLHNYNMPANIGSSMGTEVERLSTKIDFHASLVPFLELNQNLCVFEVYNSVRTLPTMAKDAHDLNDHLFWVTIYSTRDFLGANSIISTWLIMIKTKWKRKGEKEERRGILLSRVACKNLRFID
jgi:hypothetical protein